MSNLKQSVLISSKNQDCECFELVKKNKKLLTETELKHFKLLSWREQKIKKGDEFVLELEQSENGITQKKYSKIMFDICVRLGILEENF